MHIRHRKQPRPMLSAFALLLWLGLSCAGPAHAQEVDEDGMPIARPTAPTNTSPPQPPPRTNQAASQDWGTPPPYPTSQTTTNTQSQDWGEPPPYPSSTTPPANAPRQDWGTPPPYPSSTQSTATQPQAGGRPPPKATTTAVEPGEPASASPVAPVPAAAVDTSQAAAPAPNPMAPGITTSQQLPATSEPSPASSAQDETDSGFPGWAILLIATAIVAAALKVASKMLLPWPRPLVRYEHGIAHASLQGNLILQPPDFTVDADAIIGTPALAGELIIETGENRHG